MACVYLSRLTAVYLRPPRTFRPCLLTLRPTDQKGTKFHRVLRRMAGSSVSQATPYSSVLTSELETGDVDHFLIGVLALAAGFGLFMIGRPRQGVSSRFLRFESAPMLYPPAVFVFIAIGIAELFAWALAT